MAIFEQPHHHDGDNAGYVWKRVVWMLIIGGLALLLICVDTSVKSPNSTAAQQTKTDTTKKKAPDTAKIAAPPSDRVAGSSTLAITSVTEKKQPSSWSLYAQALGAAFLIAGAAFAAGGIIGFLFGIPKIQQNEAQVQAEAVIIQNDNLYLISDWITKIIVGVGLVQLKSFPHYLKSMGNGLAPVLTGDATITASASGSVICIILYFVSVGFFALYLWTRLDYVILMKSVNEKLRLMISRRGGPTPNGGAPTPGGQPTPGGPPNDGIVAPSGPAFNPAAPVTPMPPVTNPVAPAVPVPNPAVNPPALTPPTTPPTNPPVA